MVERYINCACTNIIIVNVYLYICVSSSFLFCTASTEEGRGGQLWSQTRRTHGKTKQEITEDQYTQHPFLIILHVSCNSLFLLPPLVMVSEIPCSTSLLHYLSPVMSLS